MQVRGEASNASVIDENIEMPALVANLACYLLNRTGVLNIASDGLSLVPVLDDGSHGVIQGRFRSAAHRDPCAHACKFLRDSRTDATTCARNHCYPSRQFRCTCHELPRCTERIGWKNPAVRVSFRILARREVSGGWDWLAISRSGYL